RRLNFGVLIAASLQPVGNPSTSLLSYRQQERENAGEDASEARTPARGRPLERCLEPGASIGHQPAETRQATEILIALHEICSTTFVACRRADDRRTTMRGTLKAIIAASVAVLMVAAIPAGAAVVKHIHT